MRKAPRWSRLISIFILACAWLVASRAMASPEFSGKQLRILVGVSPGGGHDLESRVFARHLPKHVPGNPSVIVQNMPGAGGVLMLSHLHRRVKPDGLTFGVIGRGQFLMAILEEVAFDPSKMPALWGVSGTGVDLVRADLLNVKTAEALLKVDPRAIVVGGRGRTDNTCVAGPLALEILGIKGYQMVCAYPGTPPIRAAMERGEITFTVTSDSSITAGGTYAEMVTKGSALPVWQTGYLTPEGRNERSPSVSGDVPTFYEVYRKVHKKSPSGILWDVYKKTTIDLSMITRVYITPPGIAADRLTALQEAMVRVTRDPAFVSEWERVFGQQLAPVTVSAPMAERLKNDFLARAPWQDFLRQFVNK
jgi:tripartite-type tricarboxylate transporter receptor subunit TctC